MADKPVNSVTTSSMIIWAIILLVVIVYVGLTKQGSSLFQKSNNQLTPAALEINFKFSGKLTKTINDAWSFIYQDKNKTSVKVGLVFSNTSQCGTKEVLKACDQKLYKVGDQVTIEGNQKDQTVTVIKLTK